MTHRQKVRQVIRDLKARGQKSKDIAPPIYRLLWLLGFKILPPHFQDPLTVARFTGINFSLLFGLLIWLWNPRQDVPAIVGFSIIMGFAIGRIALKNYRRHFEELRLPKWEDYPWQSPDRAEAPPPSA